MSGESSWRFAIVGDTLTASKVRILDTRLDLLVLVQQVAADQARLATEMQRIASELGVK